MHERWSADDRVAAIGEAREVIAAYADGADFDYVIDRLAPIGKKMNEMLG